jgi:hypothetical protein
MSFNVFQTVHPEFQEKFHDDFPTTETVEKWKKKTTF